MFLLPKIHYFIFYFTNMLLIWIHFLHLKYQNLLIALYFCETDDIILNIKSAVEDLLINILLLMNNFLKIRIYHSTSTLTWAQSLATPLISGCELYYQQEKSVIHSFQHVSVRLKLGLRILKLCFFKSSWWALTCCMESKLYSQLYIHHLPLATHPNLKP